MSKNDSEATQTDAPRKGRRRVKLLVMVGIVVMAAVAAAGAKLMLGGSAAEPEPGQVVALEAMTVNLADGHYLKLKFALQASADVDGHDGLDGSKAQDLAITHYTGRTLGELSSAAGRRQAKSQLLEAVKKAYDGEVLDIYFTEFVTQ